MTTTEATLQDGTTTPFTADQLETLIADFLREMAGEGDDFEIDRDENLLASGLVDSVGIVRLIAHVKDQTAVDIPPQDLIPDNFRTVGVMAAYVLGRLGG